MKMTKEEEEILIRGFRSGVFAALARIGEDKEITETSIYETPDDGYNLAKAEIREKLKGLLE
jgi:hypothetical protein